MNSKDSTESTDLLTVTSPTFPVDFSELDIDKLLTLEQFTAVGKMVWRLTPTPCTSLITMRICQISSSVSQAELSQLVSEKGLLEATSLQLLALDWVFPGLQHEFMVVATKDPKYWEPEKLDGPVDPKCIYLHLGNDKKDNSRVLDTIAMGASDSWTPACFFVAVEKNE